MKSGQPALRILFVSVLTLIASLQVFAGQGSSPAQRPQGTLEEHLGRGYDALKQERYDIAADEFRAALQLDPKLTMRARFPLAVALFEQSKFRDARREFEAVQSESGDTPGVMYYLGRMDLAERKFEAAVTKLNQAAGKPPFPDTYYYLGFAYFKKGDLESAERWLKQAALSSPDDASVQYQLGMVYRQQGQEENAKRALAKSQSLRQSGVDDSRLKLECTQKLQQGPSDEAHRVCDRLYDPDSADKLTTLGTLYAQHGDLQAALKPLSRAAELNPQSPQTQYNLALAHYQLNQFEQARASLAQAVERWPDLFQLVALYGAVLSRLGEDLPAYRALHRAHDLNPQDPGTTDILFLITLNLARKSQSAKQYADSLSYFKEAAAVKPQEPSPHRGLAQVYSSMGRPELASAEEQEAEKLAKALGDPGSN